MEELSEELAEPEPGNGSTGAAGEPVKENHKSDIVSTPARTTYVLLLNCTETSYIESIHFFVDDLISKKGW